MNTSNPSAPNQAELDDIMASIRTSVEAEGSKVGNGNADLMEAAAIADAAADEAAEADDILELTPAEMVANPSGEQEGPAPVEDVLGVGAAGAADAADEFDKLLAEISKEKQNRAVEVAAHKEALLADIEPLGAEPQAVESSVEEVQATGDVAPPAADVAAPPKSLPSNGHDVSSQVVQAITGEAGMQLVLPAEVLAIALRPMVQGWLDANLAGVVERLVQAEIAKLNSGA